MIPNVFQKIHKSIFTKILLVFFAAIFLLMITAGISHEFLFKKKRFPQIKRNTVNFCEYLVDNIGTPPNRAIADSLCKRMNLEVVITSENIHWVFGEEIKNFDIGDMEKFENNPDVKIGLHKGIVQIKQGRYTYLFQLFNKKEGIFKAAEAHSLIMVFTITLMILLVYYFMRRQLAPIKDLEEGVKQLGEGNLTYETPARTQDELGRLVNSFNKMREQLQQMFRTRDQLMLDVSHELRSPLTRVKIALEFIQESKSKKSIQEDVADLEKMITVILETERLNSPYGGLDFKEWNIAEIVKQISKEYTDEKPGIRLLGFPDAALVKGDEDRVKILLRNIFSNALKYSKDDGYKVEVSLRQKAGEVVIGIQDFGCGIPDEELPYIFEPFFRVDKSRSKKTGGYGLGMSLSKKIMESHGGKLEITSKEGVGTTVFLRFVK